MAALSHTPGGRSTAGEQAAPPDDQGRLCRECALGGHTCCQGHDIYITLGDYRRIWLHTRSKDFFEYRSCSDAAYADQEADPLWQQFVFRPDGSRRVLKRQPNNDCFFLTPEGCRLPLMVRPLVCRLFPHTYSAAGIDNQWDLDCPAARAMPSIYMEADIAGVKRQEALQWHEVLYSELLWEGLIDENRIDL